MNTTYSLFGMDVTQAQIIAVTCVVAGIIVMWWRTSRRVLSGARSGKSGNSLVERSVRWRFPDFLTWHPETQRRSVRSRALTPSRRAADSTASTEAVAMFACRPAP